MDKLTFDITIEYNDVKAFSFYEARRRGTYKSLKLFSIVYIVCSSIFFILSPKAFWSLALGALFIALMVFAWLPYRVRKRSKDNYYTAKTFSSPINYTIDEQEIVVKGKSYKGKYAWENVYEVRELKNMFLLYNNKLSASMIPKRYLNENELITFRNILLKQKNLKLSLLSK